MHGSKRCLICRPNHDTLYFHKESETDFLWIYCNKCGRGYTLNQYRRESDASPEEFKAQINGAEFINVAPNEVNKISFPRNFIGLYDPAAKKGKEYLVKRGLIDVNDEIYYDTKDEGIVFPYRFHGNFCGAQIRFITPRQTPEGKEWKITTIPGTRLGNLVYNWDQSILPDHVERIIVTEGAFNTLSLRSALMAYGKIYVNPFRCIALSGSGLCSHHVELLKELISLGKKVILAPDNDEAGEKMLMKAIDKDCITHYSIPPNRNEDWNDILINNGQDILLKIFLAQLHKRTKLV